MTRPADRKARASGGGRGRRRLWLWLALPPLGLLLLLAVLVGLSHVMPLNFLRPMAEAQLGAALNRPVALSGDLWIRVGPSVRFVAKGLQVDNPPGSNFPQDEFLTARRVVIDIPFASLLAGDPQIVRVVAAGGNLLFQVRADGVNNWNLAEATDDRTESSIALPQTLRIKDGRVALIDVPAKQESSIEDLQLDLTPLPIGDAAASPHDGLLPGWELAAKAQVMGQPVTLTGRRAAEAQPGVYDLQLDLQSDFVRSTLQGRVFETPLPGFDGQVQANIPSVRQLANWLQIPLDPGAADPGALDLAATLGADGRNAVLKQAVLTGGRVEGRAQGSLRQVDGGPLQLAGTADFGLLDLDAYLPPADVETELPTPIANLAVFLAIRRIAELPDSPVPLDWLDQVAGGYGLRIDRLILRELELRQADACFALSDGTARLALAEDGRAAGRRGDAADAAPSDMAVTAVAESAAADGAKGDQLGRRCVAAAERTAGQADAAVPDSAGTPEAAAERPPAGTGHLVLSLRRAAAGADAPQRPAQDGDKPAPISGPVADVTLEIAANAVPIGRIPLLFPEAAPAGAPSKAQPQGSMAHLTGNASLRSLGGTWLRLAAHMAGKVQADLSADAGADASPAVSLAVAAPAVGRPLTARLDLHGGAEALGLDLTASPLRQILLGDDFSLQAGIIGELATGSIDGVVQTRPVPTFRGTAALKSDRPGPLAALVLGEPGLQSYEPGALSLSLSVVEKGEGLEIQTASLDIGPSHFQASGTILPQHPVEARIAITGSAIDLSRLLPPSTGGSGGSGGGLPEGPVSELFPRDLKLDMSADLSAVSGAGLVVDTMKLNGTVAPGQLRLTGSGTPAGGGSLALDLSLNDKDGTATAAASLDLQAQRLGRFLAVEAGGGDKGNGSLTAKLSAAGTSLAALADSLTGEAALDVQGMAASKLHPLDRLEAQLQAGTVQTSLTAKAQFPKPKIGANDAVAIASKQIGEAAVTRNPVQGTLVCKDRLWQCLSADKVPAALTLESGNSRLGLDGTAALRERPARLAGRLTLAGKRLSDWDAAVGDALPQYGPYNLTADVSATAAQQDFKNLKLTVANSDLAGRVGLRWQAGHIVLDADLQSRQLNTKDFGSSNVEGRTFAEKVQVPTDWLSWLRGKARLKVAEMTVQPGVTMTDVTASVNSDGKRLQVERLQGAVMNGRIDLQGSLEGAARGAAAIGVKGNLKGGDLAVLAARLGKADVLSGALDAEVDMQGQGATLDEIVHRPSGQFFLQVEQGHIANSFLGIMSVKMDDLFSPLFGSSPTTKLECLQGHGTARAGVIDLPAMLLDTSIFSVTGKGRLDLPKETVDMDFRVIGERISVSSLAPAFSVSGPLANPAISFNAGETALDLAPSLLSSLAGEVANLVKGVTGAGRADSLRDCPPRNGK